MISDDGINFIHFCEFEGNNDDSTVVKRIFPKVVNVLGVRLQILEYNSHPSLRFELHYIPD